MSGLSKSPIRATPNNNSEFLQFSEDYGASFLLNSQFAEIVGQDESTLKLKAGPLSKCDQQLIDLNEKIESVRNGLVDVAEVSEAQ